MDRLNNKINENWYLTNYDEHMKPQYACGFQYTVIHIYNMLRGGNVHQLSGKELTWGRALWVEEMSGRHTLLRLPEPETIGVRKAVCPLVETSICPRRKNENNN